jgi:hypothetical protein
MFVYLPSELIDNCPLYGGFSDDLYKNTMPAARVRQCPLYKELFNREMHPGGCQHGRYKPGLTVFGKTILVSRQ